MAGRGRLGSIDLLPEEAEEDVIWVCQQLAERSRTQAEILEEFNGRLADKGLPLISKSAFNRRAIFLARTQSRVQEARAMFKGLASQFDAADVDQNNIVLGEFLKTLIIELLQDTGGDRTPKQAMELARAFASTVSAQKVSTERRQKLEADAKAKLMKAAEAAVGEVEAGGHKLDGAAVLKRIREEVYGIYDR